MALWHVQKVSFMWCKLVPPFQPAEPFQANVQKVPNSSHQFPHADSSIKSHVALPFFCENLLLRQKNMKLSWVRNSVSKNASIHGGTPLVPLMKPMRWHLATHHDTIRHPQQQDYMVLTCVPCSKCAPNKTGRVS